MNTSGGKGEREEKREQTKKKRMREERVIDGAGMVKNETRERGRGEWMRGKQEEEVRMCGITGHKFNISIVVELIAYVNLGLEMHHITRLKQREYNSGQLLNIQLAE